jgi:hypothetical protein
MTISLGQLTLVLISSSKRLKFLTYYLNPSCAVEIRDLQHLLIHRFGVPALQKWSVFLLERISLDDPKRCTRKAMQNFSSISHFASQLVVVKTYLQRKAEVLVNPAGIS